MGILNYLAELLYPPRCVMCGELTDASTVRKCLCDRCRGIWENEKKALCPNCRMTVNECRCQPKYNKSRTADSFRALVLYDSENIKRLIHSFKTERDAELINMTAKDISAAIFRYAKIDGSSVLAYPERGRKSYEKYGFDHAGLLCAKVSEYTGIPVFKGIKHRRGSQQKTLSATQRGYNALKSYHIPDKYKEQLKGRHVIFIDDVVTTGATSVVCAALCKAAGAVGFSVFSIARTP